MSGLQRVARSLRALDNRAFGYPRPIARTRRSRFIATALSAALLLLVNIAGRVLSVTVAAFVVVGYVVIVIPLIALVERRKNRRHLTL